MVEEIRRALGPRGDADRRRDCELSAGLLAFLLILVAALIVAAIVRYAVLRALNGLNFDRRAELFGAPLAEWTPSGSASKLVALRRVLGHPADWSAAWSHNARRRVSRRSLRPRCSSTCRTWSRRWPFCCSVRSSRAFLARGSPH
jgi:hypothetical protein